MNSRCSFVSIDNDQDKFSDEKLVIRCYNGQPNLRCEGAQQGVIKKGIFGYLFRSGLGDDLSPSLCWNSGRFRKAGECYNNLQRNGACWQSNNAKLQYTEERYIVKFCSYAL